MFKSIVVAFDGSPHASRALEIASRLAKQGESALGIIYVIDSSNLHIPDEIRKMGEAEHVIDPKPKMTINYENAPQAMMSTMSQVGADSLKAMFQYGDFLVEQAAEHAGRAGVKNVETTVEQGDPAEEVIAFANHREADLIVSGSRGMGKWKSMLLGSTSSKIAQLAECSCLTIRQPRQK